MQHVGAQQEAKTKLRKDAQVLKCGNAVHVLQGQWPKKKRNKMTVPLLHPRQGEVLFHTFLKFVHAATRRQCDVGKS